MCIRAHSGVSYAAGGPFALFVFHVGDVPSGRYSILHPDERGRIVADVYRFNASGGRLWFIYRFAYARAF